MMFGTQKLAPMLRRAKDAFVYERGGCRGEDAAATEDEDGSSDGHEAEEGEGTGRRKDPQLDVRIIAEMLDIDISMIYVSNQVCGQIRIIARIPSQL